MGALIPPTGSHAPTANYDSGKIPRRSNPWIQKGVGLGLQAQWLQAAGLDMLAGFELEWMVLSTDAIGAEQSAVVGGPYGADRLVDGVDYATAVLQALDAAQLPCLQFHPEFGAGQFEPSLAPGSVLEAADRVVRANL